MDLVEFINSKTAKYADQTFMTGEGGEISYGEFGRVTDQLARGFINLGMEPGDRIAVLHHNSPYVFEVYIGAIKAGAVAVPVNPAYTASEITHILEDSGARLLLMHQDFVERVKEIESPLPALQKRMVRADGQSLTDCLQAGGAGDLSGYAAQPADADTPAFTIYTSGTTGKPKGVVLTHRNLYFGGPNIAQSFGLRPGDVALAVLPMVHIFCIASPFMGSLSSGGKVVVLKSFDSDAALEAIGQHQVTWLPGVPTMFSYLLNRLNNEKHDVSSLRMGLCGGAPMPDDVKRRWKENFGAEVIDAYGLTESTGLVTCDPVYGQTKPGSIGIVASGVEAKIVGESGEELGQGEVGNLVFRGPNRAAGYYNLPEVNQERIKDGWLYTGDHAYRDQDGFVFLVGRAQELIITAGYNVYPREIEEVLYAFEGVNEAAVIGAAHAHKGEIPLAYISAKPDTDLDQEEILAFCRKHLAAYKIPRIKFLPELPKNPTGKILKKELPRD